jgi:hypothetical protein
MDWRQPGLDHGPGRPWCLDIWALAVSGPVPRPLLLWGHLRVVVKNVAWPNSDPLGPSGLWECFWPRISSFSWRRELRST